MPTYTMSPSDNALIVLHDARPAGWILAPLAAGPRIGIIDNGQQDWGVRAVSCVNACAGLNDPAADLAAMRRALTECAELIEDMIEADDTRGDFYIAAPAVLAIARRALGTDTDTTDDRS